MMIYVVQQGSYSNRGIVAIYTDKAKADTLAEALYEGDVEEFEVDAVVPPERGRKLYHVFSQPFALDIAPPSQYASDRQSRGCGETEVWQWPEGTLDVNVWARDEDHALKIAADKFREHIAREGWKR